MAKNLRDEGYPASHIDPPFKSRRVNYAQGKASAQKTTPLNEYMRGHMEDLDDNHQQEYINNLLNKVGSPLNVKRWNSRTVIDNVPYQDSLSKGYTLNQGDSRLAYLGKSSDPYGIGGTSYGAVIDNLGPLVGDEYRDWSTGDTPFGNLGISTEEGSVGIGYNTPSKKEQMYYVNALMNLLNRGQ